MRFPLDGHGNLLLPTAKITVITVTCGEMEVVTCDNRYGIVPNPVADGVMRELIVRCMARCVICN